MGLKLVIILCILSLMIIGGIYTYRFLDNKLRSSNTLAGIIFYSISLCAAIGSIYAGGLFAMAWLYDYIAG